MKAIFDFSIKVDGQKVSLISSKSYVEDMPTEIQLEFLKAVQRVEGNCQRAIDKMLTTDPAGAPGKEVDNDEEEEDAEKDVQQPETTAEQEEQPQTGE